MVEYRAVSMGEIVVMLGDITPSPLLQVTADGTPIDLDTQVTEAHLELVPLSYVADATILDSTDFVDDVIQFSWGPETDQAGALRSILRLDSVDPIPTLFGPTYTIYDPAALWANPGDVEAITGGIYTDTQVIAAILFAESIVRAWVSVPVQSPVPDAIRQATTLIAARALTTVSSGDSGHPGGQIVSESIADYTVRYANPGSVDAGGLAGWITGDVAALLAPYHGNVFDVVVAPVNTVSPLPVTLTEESWWWGDAVVYDEVIGEPTP